MEPGRPSKRTRQACEPCRRKKSKCPGQRPVCSYCARLKQTCTYSDERRPPENQLERPYSVENVSQATIAEHGGFQAWERRLGSLETIMEELLQNLRNTNRNETYESRSPSTSRDRASPPESTSHRLRLISSPPWEKFMAVAKLYQDFCDCQPLPLFHMDSFYDRLDRQEPEVMFAILALAARFSNDPYFVDDSSKLLHQYCSMARTLVMNRISEGSIELSTIQSLCILALVDSYDGNMERARINIDLASSLSNGAKINLEISSITDAITLEERRRCYWSVMLLQRFYGNTTDFSWLSGTQTPSFPMSTLRPAQPSIEGEADSAESHSLFSKDGIVSSVILLSEAWAMCNAYVKARGKAGHLLPWSPRSSYSACLSRLMEVGARIPPIYRFRSVNLAEQSADDLERHRDFWAPWLLSRFMYHTNICLLNHPLLIMLQLQNARHVPEIFLQQSSDLLSHHTTWLLHLIGVFDSADFVISDPFIAYCVAVVATIEIQLSFSQDEALRSTKEGNFTRCLRFVENFGRKWPCISILTEKLQSLRDALTESYESNIANSNENLRIDLTCLWDILDIWSSSSSATTNNTDLFGPSLQIPLADISTVSTIRALPTPTRIGSESQGLTGNSVPYEEPSLNNPLYDYEPNLLNHMSTNVRQNDMFFPASQFFSQEPQGLEGWWNSADM